MKIQALTDKGKIAIEQHLSESNRKKKLVFTQEVISEDPYILEIRLRPVFAKMVRFEDLKRPIMEAMAQNGATDEDYLINE